MILPFSPVSLGLGAALAAALFWGSVQTNRLSASQEARAQESAARSQQDVERTRAALRQSEVHREEEARREAAKQKEITHAQEQRRAAVAAAGRADRESDRLRGQLAALVSAARAREAGPDSQPAQRSPAAGAELELLADLLRGVESAGRAMAAEADAARIAGSTCERFADSLNP